MCTRKKPRVHVTIGKTTHEPGDVVEARVVLSLLKPVAGAVLTAAFQCREVVRYRDTDAVPNWFEHILHEDATALTRVNTDFSAGEHAYSAKWTIPEQMPSHTTAKSDMGEDTIESGVRVMLQRAGKRRPDVDFVYAVPVRVPRCKENREALNLVGKPVQEANTIKLKAKRGCAAGSCTIAARLETDVVDGSKPVNVQVTVTNTSGHEITDLLVEILREKKLETPQHRIWNTRSLCSWDCTAQLSAAAATVPEERHVGILLDAAGLITAHEHVDRHFIKATYAVQVTCQLSNGTSATVLLPVRVPARSSPEGT